MSDPVTNVEIEDVLSSIRRLVSDGDKARTRDPAPAVDTAAPEISPFVSAESTAPPAPTDRLVLTPAFLVVEGSQDVPVQTPAAEAVQTEAVQTDNDEDEDWHEEAWRHKPEDAAEDFSEPLSLTNMIWESIDTPAEQDAANDHSVADLSASVEKVGLAATIAELEAAFSANNEEYEPDGSEVMSETIEWPGAAARIRAVSEDAVVSDAAPEVAQATDDIAPEVEVEMPAFGHRTVEDIDVAPIAGEPVMDEIDAAADEYADDDDLDDLLETGGATLDEAAMRDLVTSVVREELAGPLGERITRNVRKLVRREIYRILSSQEFD